MTGPIFTPGVRPWPSVIRGIFSRSAATNLLWIVRSTSSREPAEQTSPWLAKAPKSAPSTAAAKSASANTMFGFLPPSSSDTRLRLPVAAVITWRPVVVPPVKAILSTFGCAASASPQPVPGPVTMFTTPAGVPASTTISARSSAVSGVSSEGLSTHALPAASAGASFQAAIRSG